MSTSYRVLRAILATAVERTLTREPQVWAIANAVSERYEALVWLAAATALRSAELSALRRCDIDLDRSVLRVERAYIEPVRQPAFFGPPKSDAGVRTVFLPAVVLPVPEDHVQRWAEPGPDGLLVTSVKGGPLSRHNRKWWRHALRSAGLNPRTPPARPAARPA